MVPLIKYLERELQYMNENLVQENFNRYRYTHVHTHIPVVPITHSPVVQLVLNWYHPLCSSIPV